jgi:hypothetical protein
MRVVATWHKPVLNVLAKWRAIDAIQTGDCPVIIIPTSFSCVLSSFSLDFSVAANSGYVAALESDMPFPTITVKDAGSIPQTINTTPNPGQVTMANSLPVAIASDQSPVPVHGAGDGTATSTPLSGSITDATAHNLGPFAPQLARQIWLTLVGAGAVGQAQILRSTDGGTTQIPITKNSAVIGPWSFGSDTPVTGVVINEPVMVETDAAATIYLSITLSAGALTYRLAQ